MYRFVLLVSLAGCTAKRVNNYHPTHAGECPDDQGCELAIPDEPRFVRPDETARYTRRAEEDALPDGPPVPIAPAAATCELVARAVAGFELGNHAEDEVRAPVAAKYEARCRTLRLTEATRACVVGAVRREEAAYCAPKLIPELVVELVDPARCGELEGAMRALQWQRVTTVAAPGPPETSKLPDPAWEAGIAMLGASCREDRWTKRVVDCARVNAAMVLEPMGCFQLAPPPLVRKLEDRVAAQRRRLPR